MSIIKSVIIWITDGPPVIFPINQIIEFDAKSRLDWLMQFDDWKDGKFRDCDIEEAYQEAARECTTRVNIAVPVASIHGLNAAGNWMRRAAIYG